MTDTELDERHDRPAPPLPPPLPEPPAERPRAAGPADPVQKSPPLAAVLSFILPGLGHLYAGSGQRAGMLFASFVLSQIVPTFPDARALRELTQRPVLGTVSLLQSPAVTAKRRRGVLMFAGGVAGLVGMFATAILLLSIRSGAI
jgi:hypothetical protein